MRSNLLASVDVIEFQTTEGYSNLYLTDVKYSTYKQCRDENHNIMERIRLNKQTNKQTNNTHNELRGLSPRVNYTDRATAEFLRN
jgi:hypothetical protein